MNGQSHWHSEWSQSRISAFLTKQKQIEKDLKYFWWHRSYDFPNFTRNFQGFLQNSRLQDLEKKRLGQIPCFFQVFQYRGSPMQHEKVIIITFSCQALLKIDQLWPSGRNLLMPSPTAWALIMISSLGP